MLHEETTARIIGGALRVQSVLGPGFLESVYQNALAIELRHRELHVQCGYRIHVLYEGVVVGDFVCDMLVAGTVLVENKAVRALGAQHDIQLVNYLTATGLDVGLLLNFGKHPLEIRRKVRELEYGGGRVRRIEGRGPEAPG